MKTFNRLIIMLITIFLLTACHSKKEEPIIIEEKQEYINNTFYCTNNKYDYYFKYDNNILTMITYTYPYNKKDYKEYKSLEKELTNIKVIKDKKTFKIDIDLTKEGLSLEDLFPMFEQYKNPTWSNIENYIKEAGFECSIYK